MDHTTLIHLISAYGPFILLPIMIVEGPIITVVASFLASLGILNVFLVYVLAYLGNVIGDAIYYSLGRYGRERFILRYGKYIGLTQARIEYIEVHYQKHFLKTILIGKVTEAPIVPILVAAGTSRVDFRKFLFTVSSIEIFKVLIFVCVGFYFGKFYKVINTYFENSVLAIGIICVLIVLFFVFYNRLKAKKV
jgi:membrane protein DedA with SNARE-associated domain